MNLPKAPADAGPAGRRLWRAVLTDFELAEHEMSLLRQAARAADLCEQLQKIVDEQGPLATNRLGDEKPHPALVELRQQRLVLARLIVALRVPLGDQEGEDASSPSRTQRRALRGVYGGAA
jgi:hypothetical protein